MIKQLAITVAALISASGIALAQEPVSPPKAAVVFCLHHMDQCVGSDVEQVEFTQELFANLEAVNQKWNSQIIYTSDVGDTWEFVTDAGDCEDYAIAKRYELAQEVDVGALRFALTKSRNVWHIVLVVKTSAGDFVLDNLSNEVKLLEDTNYVIYGMSSADNPFAWFK